MGENQYRVLFIADERDGIDISALRQNLSQLFELDDTLLETLFTGLPVVIKNSADQNTAMKFRTAIIESGGIAWIEEVAPGQEEYSDRRALHRRNRDERRVRERKFTAKADRRKTDGRRRDDDLDEEDENRGNSD